MAYDALEPFGERRADLRAAIVATLIANANRDPDKKREPFTVDDFMPKFDRYDQQPEQQTQTWEQQKLCSRDCSSLNDEHTRHSECSPQW